MECIKHELVQPYETLYEKETEVIARFMFTTILMPAGPLRITGSFFDPKSVSSTKMIKDTSLLELLASNVRKNKTSAKKTTDNITDASSSTK